MYTAQRDITDKLVKDYSCEQIISLEIKSIAAIKAKAKEKRRKNYVNCCALCALDQPTPWKMECKKSMRKEKSKKKKIVREI